MNGYWWDCPTQHASLSECKPKRIICAHGECPADAPTDPDVTEAMTEHEHDTGLIGLRGKTSRRAAVRENSATTLTSSEDDAEDEGSGLPGGVGVMSVRKGDIFSVGHLFEAARVHLDDTGGFPGTYRSRGVVLVIHIEYANRPDSWQGLKVLPGHMPTPTYSYRISTRTSYDYRVTRSYDDPALAERKIRTYNGIRVVVEQSGKLVQFSPAAFLVTITAALGLLAVATTVTEFIMGSLLARSGEYTARKYYDTKDFNEENCSEEDKDTLDYKGHEFLDAIGSQDGEGTARSLQELLDQMAKEKAKEAKKKPET